MNLRLIGIFLLFVWGCQTRESSPQLAAPSIFSDTIPFPARNPFSEEGILLGKKLFFDPLLSKDNRVSCGMCHQPAKAFTDGHTLTRMGVTGKRLDRHTPALINLAWNDGLFWDGGAKDLESLVFAPLTHPDEMAQDLNELVLELSQHPEYPTLFQQVFKDKEIKTAYVARALAQYQRTLVSADAHYDRVMRGEASFSELELKGKALFEQHCASCHPAPFFTDHAYHNNGLDSLFPEDKEGIYQGRYRITLNPADMGAFKTPTLRNVALTSPYMHDGRFRSLEAVLNHYRSGVLPSPTLDSLLQKEGLGLPLTDQDQTALLAFLHTLTDTTFLKQ